MRGVTGRRPTSMEVALREACAAALLLSMDGKLVSADPTPILLLGNVEHQTAHAQNIRPQSHRVR